MTEEQLRELFKATNTEEPLCGGWPGLFRYGQAVAAAEREYYRDAIKKAAMQINGAMCYHTMEANHEQLKDALKTLAEVLRAFGAQPGTAGTGVGCTAGDGG